MARSTTYIRMGDDGKIVATVVEGDSNRVARTRRSRALQPSVMLPEEVEMYSSVLMGQSRSVPASEVDSLVPQRTGLYLFRLRAGCHLPEPFESIRPARDTSLIYLGKAENSSLSTRMVHQELRGRGRGTFIRSLGAVLGYRPITGSLLGEANPNNYVFSPQDLAEVVAWINANLEVAWVAMDQHIAVIEKILIAQHTPLLNITDNPLALPKLRQLRRECRRVGLTPPVQ